ncbi:chitobiosyldiphosphodolichol beta-mannosyltransferase [Verticillium alfalfae VaMs.102]|uniref:Chitobiosyldiphosphodolichol beta-mannosyltransferase n=1 Tax=Verticillium alfalfae (strain VaMs.102 / ATCC MYA-4576 / FGSC 10136) TaxID=526221 RepID=C9S844_VERA1|nr:chitobiosyldiphosphodolichol beta-mannosyltransferase [Verticillium alfalfae VaMs.102]EEY14890.1 chitobiosyldiphosphodolichol beta-mannosyltransferase [Verticillium alfalfae VaMs.102]
MALVNLITSTALVTIFMTLGIFFYAPHLVGFIPTRYVPAADARDDHIQVLVLGDVGRSPRMQYHALSVVKNGGRVDLVGYNESPLHPQLVDHDRATLYPLPELPSSGRGVPPFMSWPNRLLASRLNIIQKPPSIPTLHLALIISVLRGSHLLVDWHNYGWSILATTRGRSNRFVQTYLEYESFFGRITPTANLTVTDAMARQLRKPPYSFEKPIFTLHDRPADIFQPILDATTRRKTLARVLAAASVADATTLAPLVDGILRGDIRLIVSSTSWTPDEDFNLLLSALVAYAEGDRAETRPLLAIITGKGPQKAAYEDKILRLTSDGRLSGIQIKTAFLTIEDYAALLAVADLGVCLHMSSSGVDLPMKVVDMFGAGLPVAAYSDYESFGELIKEGENGCGFETAEDLEAVLRRLLSDEGRDELAFLKRGAVEEGRLRWDTEWDRVVGRVVGLVDP